VAKAFVDANAQIATADAPANLNTLVFTDSPLALSQPNEAEAKLRRIERSSEVRNCNKSSLSSPFGAAVVYRQGAPKVPDTKEVLAAACRPNRPFSLIRSRKEK
jgi:hypothetical protein